MIEIVQILRTLKFADTPKHGGERKICRFWDGTSFLTGEAKMYTLHKSSSEDTLRSMKMEISQNISIRVVETDKLSYSCIINKAGPIKVYI